MKKLTERSRERLRRMVLVISVLVLVSSAIVLWENRRGTPGEPKDFYYTLIRDGVELNRPVMESYRVAGYPHYLVVDLSDTGLSEEERAEVLARLGEKYPRLTVLDLPMEEPGGSYHMPELAAEVSAATGTSVDDLMHYAGLSPLRFEVKSPLPPREQFGVEPIRVDYLMWWDGWRGRRNVFYRHYPLGGWRWSTENFKDTAYQIS